MKALPLVCLAAVLSTSACSRSSDKVTIDLRRNTKGTAVATYNGGVITEEDVSKALAQLPPMVRLRYQTPQQKKEFLERLVTLDLVAREAVRQGVANDPEVVEMVKNVLAQKLVKEEREKQAPVVSDEEAQAWYDAHTGDFTRPETWRVSTLFLAIPSGDAAKEKAQMAKAEKLLALAKKLKPDDFAGFGQLVKANSEDPSKALDGDLRALSTAELTSRYGPEVAAAAKALQNPGDLSDLVRTKNGVHLLKLRLHTPTAVSSFADVKAQIKTRLQNEHRNQAYEKFIADLKTQAKLTVDEAALAKVVVDMKSPDGQAGLRTALPPPTAAVPAPAPRPAVTPPPPPPAKQ